MTAFQKVLLWIRERRIGSEEDAIVAKSDVVGGGGVDDEIAFIGSVVGDGGGGGDMDVEGEEAAAEAEKEEEDPRSRTKDVFR